MSILALAGGFVDYAITADGLPALGPSATVDDPVFAERDQIREDFGQRVWFYAVGFLILLGAALAIAIRSGDAESRRQLFVDLGVAGVLAAGLGFYLASREPELMGDSNGEGVFALVPVAMLLVAAAGGLITRAGFALRTRAEGGQVTEANEQLAPIGGLGGQAISRVALALAALTVLLVLVGSAGRECDDAGDFQNLSLWAAFLVSLGAAAAGLASLVARRWVAALITIPAPLIAGVAILAAACLE